MSSAAQEADAGRNTPKASRSSRFKRPFSLRSRKPSAQSTAVDSHKGQQAQSSAPSLPQEPDFNPSDILPQDGHNTYNSPNSELETTPEDDEDSQPVFGAPRGAAMSDRRSPSPPSVFDDNQNGRNNDTPPTTTNDSEEQGDYDLKPPAPKHGYSNVETLATRFFSSDHLDLILRDPALGPRFTKFMETYKPQHAKMLKQYIESKKALIAIEYANAIADSIPATSGGPPCAAASLDDTFEEKTRQTSEYLVEEALPAYLTNRLVASITDVLVKEITGNSSPMMRDLVPSLAEVYCLADPSLPDNPIVYASDEFYNTTQYGSDYVIGRNCRFLQGPKTKDSSVRRIVEALNAGEELIETVLNYKRDGTPFMNLLMVAPMYDNKGDVRYYLGAQIDISQLVEDGKGLDSFSKLLAQDRSDRRYDSRQKTAMNLLGELGQMLNEQEATAVKERMRTGSLHQVSESGRSTPQQKTRPNGRRIIGYDDANYTEGAKRQIWPDLDLGRSGRLPGVYKNYMLVRPHPSLRITFTSPALRIPGLLQTKFLDRIAGPKQVKEGVEDALAHGTSVTAKVQWLTHAGDNSRPTGNEGGKTRWIHCTPLFGSDDRVGVWMVVLVEDQEVAGALNRTNSQMSGTSNAMSRSGGGEGTAAGQKAGASGTRGNVLYADYLKADRNERPMTQGTSSSTREQREVDGQFRDF